MSDMYCKHLLGAMTVGQGPHICQTCQIERLQVEIQKLNNQLSSLTNIYLEGRKKKDVELDRYKAVIDAARNMMKADPSLLNNSLGSAYSIKHYCEVKEALLALDGHDKGGNQT